MTHGLLQRIYGSITVWRVSRGRHSV